MKNLHIKLIKSFLNRVEVQDICNLSNGGFERVIIKNSLFIAFYGRHNQNGMVRKLYKRQDLIDHFNRLAEGTESALLLYRYYTMIDDEFEKNYKAPKSVVFAKGTNITIGGNIIRLDE